MLEPSAKFGGIAVRDDNELVWVAIDGPTIVGAATTLLWDDGEAELRLAGGQKHREWISPLDATVSAWAKAAGANKLTMRGRKGWGRYARPFGWVALGTDDDGLHIYEKDLQG